MWHRCHGATQGSQQVVIDARVSAEARGVASSDDEAILHYTHRFYQREWSV
jgi:hypothetical protein